MANHNNEPSSIPFWMPDGQPAFVTDEERMESIRQALSQLQELGKESIITVDLTKENLPQIINEVKAYHKKRCLLFILIEVVMAKFLSSLMQVSKQLKAHVKKWAMIFNLQRCKAARF